MKYGPFFFVCWSCITVSTWVYGDELKDISALINQGQSLQALEKATAYLGEHPKDLNATFLKGVAEADAGKSIEAIQTFSRLTEQHPELPEPYNNLAALYAAQGQYEKARTALEKAIRTHPSYAAAHDNLGDIYARMASEAYDKALQLDRSNTAVPTKLTMVKTLFSENKALVVAMANKPEAKTVPVVVANALLPKPEVPKSQVVVPVQPAPQMTERKVAEKLPSPSEVKPVSLPVTPADQEKNTQKPKPEPKENEKDSVRVVIEAWAKAWSARNVEGYLSYYSEDFKTPNGETRGEWAKMRKERIRKPTSIHVEVLSPHIEVEDNRATVVFKQSYRAGGNSMRTNKTLKLRQVGKRWLITQELADH